MQIQLTQPEIIAALKQYIAAQGIALTGKKVIMSFTASRKGSGISADISIEDSGMPEITIDDPVESKPALSIVSDTSAAPQASSETPPSKASLFS
jgi:hypothetical protein